MRDEHDMKLIGAASITFFRKVLNQLDIHRRGLIYAAFKELSKFIIHDKYAIIT